MAFSTGSKVKRTKRSSFLLVGWVLWTVVLSHSLRGERLNVLFIAVDDLRPELGVYGSRAQTPHLDELASEGVVFQRAYCNQAVCGASRLAVMLGLYPEHTDERTFHVRDWRKRWPDVLTLNQHLTASGYTTVGLGKIYHGTGGPGVDPEHWTRWLGVRGAVTYADPENARAHAEAGKRLRPGSSSSRLRGPMTEFADVEDTTYADGLRAEFAVEQIGQLAEGKKPFFLAVGFTKPHLPFIAPKRYWDLYERESFDLPDNLGLPPGYPEWAANVHAGEMSAYCDRPAGAPATFSQDLNRRLLHGYFACVSYMDAQVGRLLQALDDHEVAEKTVVIFWADHGWKLGDHQSWCKHTNFECDTQVPLIVRYPNKARGAESTALVELIDLYPTLCAWLDLKTPAHLQGKSFAALLDDPAADHRESAYSSYPHTAKGEAGRVIGHSIRTSTHRYTEWWQRGTDRVVDSVLTDIEKDPGETTRVEATFENERLRERLARHLRSRVMAARNPRP